MKKQIQILVLLFLPMISVAKENIYASVPISCQCRFCDFKQENSVGLFERFSKHNQKEAKDSQCDEKSNRPDCDFTGSDFSNAHLDDIELQILGSNYDTCVKSYDFSLTNFSSSQLKHANIGRLKLNFANFTHADLTGARIRSSVSYVNFTHANLANVLFPRDRASTGQDFNFTNFSYANLSRADLSGNFRFANFSHAIFNDTRLNTADPDLGMSYKTKLNSAILWEGVNFSYSDLSKIKFKINQIGEDRSQSLDLSKAFLCHTIMPDKSTNNRDCAKVEAGYPQPNPYPSFKIMGNLYYIGTDDLASYLIVTSKGNILINSDMELNVPLLKNNVEQLGFKWQDTKILLISHAHLDHAAGSRQIREETKAKYMVMEQDVALVISGGHTDFFYGKDAHMHFPKTDVDKVLHDGSQIKLGDTVLTAHLTPGHTPGNTTWTLPIVQDGKTIHVVIVGSLNVNPGYRLVNNKNYPNIATDFARSFKVMKSLPCDIFLGAHAIYFNLDEKYREMLRHPKALNPFIDPQGYKRFIATKEQDFKIELAKQG